MGHVQLPSDDEPRRPSRPMPPTDASPTRVTEVKQVTSPTTAIDLEEAMSDRVVLKMDETDRLYGVRVKLAGKSMSGLFFVVHKKKFPQSELNEMTAEAIAICNEKRIPARRQEMADKPFDPTMADKTNEILFEGDVDFVEAVMVDKFGFRKVIHISSEGEVVPTIVT